MIIFSIACCAQKSYLPFGKTSVEPGYCLQASIAFCINGTALIRLSGFKPKSDTEIILLAEMLFAQSKSADSKHVFNDRNVLMCFYSLIGVNR